MDLANLVQPVQLVAQEAGRHILEIYNTDFTVTKKSDRSLLTEADLVAHKSIVQGLTAIDHHIPILSEEAADISFTKRCRWEWLWLVDPLDGTREFVKRSGQFSVNIALIHYHKPVFGLILIPMSGVWYFGYRHGGAFKQFPEQLPRVIHTRKIGPSSRIRVAGSRTYTGRSMQDFLDGLGDHDYLGVGSALKSCLVAEGKVDLYPRFGPTSEWDTAAAQIIVEEAGGGLTDFQMRALRYNARPTLINPDFFVFGDPSHNWSQYLTCEKSGS